MPQIAVNRIGAQTAYATTMATMAQKIGVPQERLTAMAAATVTPPITGEPNAKDADRPGYDAALVEGGTGARVGQVSAVKRPQQDPGHGCACGRGKAKPRGCSFEWDTVVQPDEKWRGDRGDEEHGAGRGEDDQAVHSLDRRYAGRPSPRGRSYG